MDEIPKVKPKPIPPNKWKKGQSGNPNGRGKLPEELRQIKALTSEELNRYLAGYARMPAECVKEHALNPRTPALEAVIASAFTAAIENGEPHRLQVFLDRALPKPKEVPNININLASLSDAELVEMAKDAIKTLSRPNEPLTLDADAIDAGNAGRLSTTFEEF